MILSSGQLRNIARSGKCMSNSNGFRAKNF